MSELATPLATADNLRELARREAALTDESSFRTVDEESLSSKQRGKTVALALLFVVLFLGCSVAYGTFHRGWSVISSLYFAVVTFTTVGYGDLNFVNHENYGNIGGSLEKCIGSVFVFCGVVFIGAAAGAALNEFAKLEEAKTKLGIRTAQADIVKIGAHSTAEVKENYAFDRKKEVHQLFSRLWKRELPIILVTSFSGAVVMSFLEEDWDIIDGFYWASVTMTTVGYGDLSPSNDTSRLFAILYIFLAFGVIASAVSFVASIPFEMRRLEHVDQVLKQFGDSLDFEELKALAQANEIRQLRTHSQHQKNHAEFGVSVSRSEFVVWQLQKQGKIEFEDDVQPILNVFDQLDSDDSGRLTVEDIVHSIEKKHTADLADTSGQ